MQKKSIIAGLLALVLFSTVVYAFYGDDEDNKNSDSSGNLETSLSDGSQKTWKHTMTVHVQNGKAVSPADEIKVETNAEIIAGGTRKSFWLIEDSIVFSFNLPNKARLKLDFKCTSNESLEGIACVQMNGNSLRDANRKRKTFTFRDSETTTIILDAKEGKNTLMLFCTGGEIGLELLTITADVDYPNWDFNGLKIWLTSPNPGKALDGSPVPIRWEVTSGLADNGWVKVLYRVPGQDWEVVPGMEGISYGKENWGNFIWENPPVAQSCEFDFKFQHGENPVEIQKEADARKGIAISAAMKRLIQAKKKFLDETYQLIPLSFWNKYLKELKSPCLKLRAQLEVSLEDEEDQIDHKKVAQIISDLEQNYFIAFQKMMKIVPALEDQKEREDFQANVEQFMSNLSEDFSIANFRYGEQEDTKELIPIMFPKDRFEAFKKAKNEFDSAMGVSTPNTENRKVLTANGIEYVFCWCPPGEFLMSSPEDEPDRYDDEKQHKVKLTKGFWILETEVTQKMWQSVMGTNPSNFKGKQRPVENVSWVDCQEFCRKLSQLLNQPVQLPTEAQWEYACRAGTTTPFSFGSTLNGDSANCNGKFPYGTSKKGPCQEATVDVGSYEPNAWGLCDMHGNVREWCSDWYDEDYYSESPTNDPENKTVSSHRVNRGGSWDCSAGFCRSANRSRFAPEEGDSDLGFRICFIPGQAE